MKIKGKRLKVERTGSMSWYQDDKQLYSKIHQRLRSSVQFLSKGFLFAWSYCVVQYNIISPALLTPILILMLSATSTVFFCPMLPFEIHRLKDSALCLFVKAPKT